MDSKRYYWVGFFILSAYSAMLTIYFGRGLSFTPDEYTLLGLIARSDLGDMLSPYVGHLTVVSQLIYLFILETFKSSSYLPFQILLAISKVFLAAMVFIYARRRTTDINAILIAAVILFFAADYLHAVFGNGIIILLSLGFGVAALNFWDRKLDIAASIMLVLAIGSYTTGVPFAIGIAVLALIYRRKSTWVAGAPLFLYLIWRMTIASSTGQEEDTGINLFSLIKLPEWILENTHFTIESIFPGTVIGTSFILAILFFLFIGYVLIFKKDREILATLSILVALFAAQVVVSDSFRSDIEDNTRYLYPNLVALLLVTISIAKNLKFITAPLFLITLTSITASLFFLDSQTEALKEATPIQKAKITAIRIIESAKPKPPLKSEPRGIGTGVRAEFDLKSASAWGEIGYSPSLAPFMDDRINRTIDDYLTKTYKPRLKKPLGFKINCQVFKAGDKIFINWSGINIKSASLVDLRLGRFSQFPLYNLGTLKEPSSIQIRKDSQTDNPWFIKTTGPVTVCR